MEIVTFMAWLALVGISSAASCFGSYMVGYYVGRFSIYRRNNAV